VLEICRTELDRVVAGGITADELARGRSQLRGATVLGLEDTGSRMSRIAKGELFGDLRSVEDVLASIESVSAEVVRLVAEDLLTASPTLAVVGPFDDAAAFAGIVG
jgi:predicted Zn-dependent peptidase